VTFGRLPDEAGRVEVAASAGGYPVVVGSGVLEALPEVADAVVPGRRLAVISDTTVLPLHGVPVAERLRSAGREVAVFDFPAGEASKSRRSWAVLTDEMLQAGFGRDSCVVAVGGGVTTDLAGFVAATFLRGVPVLQVPTSTLAMIDASVGGKTGVDVRAGKNLVGAFHPPVAVVADVLTLATLPPAQRAQGLVEAIKHGAILDEGHFEAVGACLGAVLAGDAEAAVEVILGSVRLKAGVVERDEFEGGFREVLNFGHTIGHALEAASKYGLGHGSAVAAGMLAESTIGERMGITKPGTTGRLNDVLRLLLGDVIPMGDADTARQYLSSDKKARAGQARFVLLERIGRAAGEDGWAHPVPGPLVDEVLSSLYDRP
jgi:3-dehydroquinate synthase